MPPLAKDLNKKYTYADYLTWDDEERWELIEGVPYCMTPAPLASHQHVSGEIFGNLWSFIKGKPCRAFAAPFDIRLTADSDTDDSSIENVVQPDISVICDEQKIDKRGCLGPPDVIIEILSPATAYRDETEKLKLYEQHGVKEYWIVNPDARYVMVYNIADNKFGKPPYYTENETLTSPVLKGFTLELTDIWSD